MQAPIWSHLCIVQPYHRLLAWLLLYLGRALLPEAWGLALHHHEHTSVEPAQAKAFRHTGKALLSVRHQHCPVKQFYNVAHQAAAPLALPHPRRAPRYAVAAALPPVRPAAGEVLFARSLRGPPGRA